jgi:sulfide:quinone oxidoreductase
VKRIVILGGGVGGTIVANVLAKKARDAEVTLVDKTGKHVYQPGYVYVAFDKQKPHKIVRDERKLLRRRVNLRIAEVDRVDPKAKQVLLKGGDVLPYDYLVIATGSRLAPEEIPGSEAAHHFYSVEGALRLREALATFPGGRIVITVGGVPYKCPPAPAESACLLDYYFDRRGLRDKVDIHFLSPLGRVFPIESVSPAVQKIFDDKGIRYTTFFNAERVDPEQKVVHSLEGEAVPFDLLILIPPHHGAKFAQDSGLTDAGGWIPTDKHTLEVKGHAGAIWAIGDTTDIPISKAGATAHYEAKVVAENLASLVRGEPPTARYDGKVMCFCDAGKHRGIALRFDYEHPPIPPPLGRKWYIAKVILNKLYWHIVPKARA